VITDEPVRGRFAYLDHPGLLALTGLEQMRRFQRKDLPYGPIWYLTGTDLVEVGVGTSTWRLPVTGWLRSAAGTLTGGVLAFAADAALGGALYTTFPPATFLATSELSLHFLRPARPDSEAVLARGRLLQAGRSQGVTEATLEDARGRLLAHATSRNVIMRLPSDPPPPPPDSPIPWPRYEGPHPFQRPAEGEVIPQETWDRLSGAEMCRAWMRGDVPPAPISLLIGAHDHQVSEGGFSFRVPASQWFCTGAGTIYGGTIALVADLAMNGAVHATVDAGTSWATLDLKVNFLRPATPDGRDLTARGTVLHRGRTIAVSSAEVVGADGKTVALANSSAMLLPGRPWQPSEPATPLDEAAPADD
jgi:uncharacterized protein (TIGR00369 family)